MARVRRDVWKLDAQDETLVWYARAVAAMRGRPVSDPTSWRFQAAIHDYDPSTDPFSHNPDPLPPQAIQAKYWFQCQHGTWFFLPWHRMYLYFFEQIVLAEVKKLGGPEDWALPYWNYSASDETRRLPLAFRDPADPSTNPLYTDRHLDCNTGGINYAPPRTVNLRRALTQADFSTKSKATTNFGGFPTPFEHNGGGFGELEIVPHGAMHINIGGPDPRPGRHGWMSDPSTAALDPIFWLHHANIDRLWQVWLNRAVTPPHQNPTDNAWCNQVPFTFIDPATGQATTKVPQDVLDTTTLGYTYEDTSDPLAAAPPAALLGSPASGTEEEAMSDTIPPEMVGASETNVQVSNTHTRIHVPVRGHKGVLGRRNALAAAAGTVSRHLLQLENLTAPAVANSYEVYVNIPEGGDPDQHPERFAGIVDLFGIAKASRASDQHPGTGLTYTLDISDIYNELSSRGDWDPNNIHVSLVPVHEAEGEPVTVGRVSLHVA